MARYPLQIISGGQTGADMGGLLGARAAGIHTGGTAPRGYKTERGPNPDLRTKFHLRESLHSDYIARTEDNVLEAEATVVFGNINSVGTRRTLELCTKHHRPTLVNPTAAQLAAWVQERHILVLNVAGNRESKNPGLQAKVTAIIAEAFSRDGEGDGGPH